MAASTAERLFPFEDPIGRAVRIEEAFYVVVGVMKERTPTAGIGGSLAAQEFNHDVYIPISTLWSRIGDLIVTHAQRLARGRDRRAEPSHASRSTRWRTSWQTAELVKETLRRHHRVEDYGVTVPLELLEQAQTTRLMFIIFMGLIAAISLVVGGIGIMNIMLATVTERTREIGIRRALGAKRRDIIRQFLVETVALSIVGGLTGILGGLTCGPVMNACRSLLERTRPDSRPPVARGDPVRHARHRALVAAAGVRHFADHRRGFRHLSGPSGGDAWIRSKRCGTSRWRRVGHDRQSLC